MYDYFQKIWDLRTRHMVKNLPAHYVFQLLPCFQNECIHPVCISGKPQNEYCWYEGGPPLSYLPVPISDTKRLWGGESCETCKGHSNGHYLNADENLKNYQQHGKRYMTNPPSDVLKREKGDSIDEEEMAKQMLLSIDAIRMWCKHIEDVSTRRKLGAKKGAATRKANTAKNAGN